MIIVHINPIEREEIPTTAIDIGNRLNEITLQLVASEKNSAPSAFVLKLLDEKWIRDEYRRKLKQRARALHPGRRGAEGSGRGHQIQFSSWGNSSRICATGAVRRRSAGLRRTSSTSASAPAWTSGRNFLQPNAVPKKTTRRKK